MHTKWFVNLSLMIAALFSFNACQNSDDEAITTLPPEINENPHAISIEEALSTLESFLKDKSTRANESFPKIINVIPVKPEKKTTRAVDIDANNLIYIANFSDEKGFAILAADDRIHEKVIAVADKSNLTKEDVDAVTSFLNSNGNYINPNYPTSGDGLFTLKEYPDEVFLNPNTFSTYDETQKDNWVGNFSEEGNLPITRGVASFNENGERTALSLCMSFANDELLASGGGMGGGGTQTTDVTYSDWKDVQRTHNILSAYHNWEQKPPFNDLYPYRRKYLFFGHKQKAPAGCFPLVIAKILTHFRRPERFSYDGKTVDWDALSNVYTSKGSESAAILLKGISECCGSLYFHDGTFTFPSKAMSFLKGTYYTDINKSKYNFDKITSMINNGCPVIIYAVPGVRIWKSHAWNIDGYKIKVRQKTTKQYINGRLIGTFTLPDTCRMVHCDFGWNGRCNGYYVDGVFKLNNDKNDYDDPELETKKTEYNRHIRIITYKKPI